MTTCLSFSDKPTFITSDPANNLATASVNSTGMTKSGSLSPLKGTVALKRQKPFVNHPLYQTVVGEPDMV